MFSILTRYSLLYVVCFYIHNTNASSVVDPYTVTVTYHNNLADAYSRGLEQVLTRVSGSMLVLERPSIKKQLEEAQHFVSSYRFIDKNIQITFSESEVNRHLNTQKIPIWERLRPQISLWLLVEGRNPLIIHQERSSTWSSAVDQSAEQFALPIQLPTHSNLKDITARDLRGYFFYALRDASLSHAPDALVIACARETVSSLWQLDWEMQATNPKQSKMNLSGQQEGLPAEVIFELSQSIASHLSTLFYVDHSAPSRTIPIRIDQVAQLNDIAHLQKSLEKLTLVTHVTLTQTGTNWVTFNLRTGSSAEKIRRALALVPHLIHRENVVDALQYTFRKP